MDAGRYDPPTSFEYVKATDRYWIDGKGDLYEFKELDTDHLNNILKILEKHEAEIPIMLLVELRLR